MKSMAGLNIPLEQLYPRPGWDYQLNCCGNPDCGNFGTEPDLSFERPKGRNAPQQRAAMNRMSNAFAVGRGVYKLAGASTAVKDRRLSRAFEYETTHFAWSDERTVRCQHQLESDVCDYGFTLLSDQHLADEIARLETYNGVLDGPCCGACGRRYLDAPDEFLLNGVNRATAPDEGPAARDDHPTEAVRLIHRPCRGRAGARFTVSLPHARQRKSSDNQKILRGLVNSTGIQDLRRIIGGTEPGEQCGIDRLYRRIFWLEAVLLAFERAQIAQWKARVEAKGEPVVHRMSHDDIVLGVNWQSDTDRRITPLNCSVSADADSGYVYRIDVDFDPRVGPMDVFRDAYTDGNGDFKNLRGEYAYRDGTAFTHPLFHFQRPTGRLDEHAFFAACLNQLGVFRETKAKRVVGVSKEARKAARDELDERLKAEMERVELIYRRWFDLKQVEREYRASFSGVTVRQIYTKAAHFAALKGSLPRGEICLMTEQEGTLARSLPHMFRQEIEEDRFTWLVVSFDKEAKKPQIEDRTKIFRTALRAHMDAMGGGPAYEDGCLDFIRQNMRTAFHNSQGGQRPWPISNFHGPAFPQIWVHSPIQASGETNKVVGFPVLPRRTRTALKQHYFTDEITTDWLRDEIGELVWRATLQPASTFMNSLRERLSLAARAGSGGARSGGSFVQGAMFNPRVLIAILNIFRIHYNFFELRTYVAPWNVERELKDADPATFSVRIPGADERVPVYKRRSRKPRRTTPAIRHGIQVSRKEDPRPPRLAKVLYEPWLFHDTPLWIKFRTKGIDLRRKAPVATARRARARPRAEEVPDRDAEDAA
jgi:hypothetical protein